MKLLEGKRLDSVIFEARSDSVGRDSRHCWREPCKSGRVGSVSAVSASAFSAGSFVSIACLERDNSPWQGRLQGPSGPCDCYMPGYDTVRASEDKPFWRARFTRSSVCAPFVRRPFTAWQWAIDRHRRPLRRTLQLPTDVDQMDPINPS